MTYASVAMNWSSSASKKTVQRYSSTPIQYTSTDFTMSIDALGPFTMKKTLRFDIEYAKDGIILSNDEADLHAAGTNMIEAKEDLLDELNLVWREYALCDDDQLDDVARGYKGWLLNNIEGP